MRLGNRGPHALSLLAVLALSGGVCTAGAQAVPAAEAAKQEPAPDAPPAGPPARTGFQLGFRTGLAFPFGDATGQRGDSLARRYAFQLPLIFDVGVKVAEPLYLGGYFALAFGSEGSDARIEGYCDDNDDNLQNDISCSVVSIHLGLRGQYHLAPSATLNPWLGYGFGIESVYQTITDRVSGYDEANTTSGYSYAKLEAGLDVRKAVGFGPFIDLSLGRYLRQRTQVNGEVTYSGPIDDTAWHLWLTLGMRLLVFP